MCTFLATLLDGETVLSARYRRSSVCRRLKRSDILGPNESETHLRSLRNTHGKPISDLGNPKGALTFDDFEREMSRSRKKILLVASELLSFGHGCM